MTSSNAGKQSTQRSKKSKTNLTSQRAVEIKDQDNLNLNSSQKDAESYADDFDEEA